LSALGQKQAYAAQQGMSALVPKADCAVHLGMSALGQKQTYAVRINRDDEGTCDEGAEHWTAE